MRRLLFFIVIFLLLLCSCNMKVKDNTLQKNNDGIDLILEEPSGNEDQRLVHVDNDETSINYEQKMIEVDTVEYKSKELMVMVDVLNIRSTNSTSSDITGRLYKGSVVSALSESYDTDGQIWYQITYEEREGWIAGWFCESLPLDNSYFTGSAVKEYFSNLLDNPTTDTIMSYAKELESLYQEVKVKTNEELETEKYLVFSIESYVEENWGTTYYCVWEKGRSDGGNVYTKDDGTSSLIGWMNDQDPFLLIWSGTCEPGITTIWNVKLPEEAQNAIFDCANFSDLFSFEGTDWIIYDSMTDNDIRTYEYARDIVLLNLTDGTRVLYKEADGEIYWELQSQEDARYLEIVQVVDETEYEISTEIVNNHVITSVSTIGDMVLTRNPYETIDLTRFPDFSVE